MQIDELPLWHADEDCGLRVMARVVDFDGNLLTQAAVSSLAYKVIDLDNNNEVTGSDTPAAADVVDDTEQFDSAWPFTGTGNGYNFSYVIPASAIPTGNHQYIVQFLVTPASGEVFKVGPWRIHAQKTF